MRELIVHAALRHYAPHFRQATHHHDTASVSLVLRGMLRESACRAEVTAQTLSLVVKPAGIPHADIFGPEPVTMCQILVRPEVHDSRRWRASLDRWRWVVGGPGVRAALALARVLRTSDRGADEVHEAAAAVLDALEGCQRTTPEPPWMSRVTDFLHAQIARGHASVRVAEAAAAVGIHPVHLSRVFHSQFGCTVSAWIRRHRVQRAAARLETANETLSVTASRSGFADHSHMNRAFQRETTLLPSGFRGLVSGL